MNIYFPASIQVSAHELALFKSFLQGMAARWAVGGLRYGTPNSKAKYRSWIDKELKAYDRTGNMEHLVNVAVYAYLEVEAPSHPKFHWDPAAKSATRKEKRECEDCCGHGTVCGKCGRDKNTCKDRAYDPVWCERCDGEGEILK